MLRSLIRGAAYRGNIKRSIPQSLEASVNKNKEKAPLKAFSTDFKLDKLWIAIFGVGLFIVLPLRYYYGPQLNEMKDEQVQAEEKAKEVKRQYEIGRTQVFKLKEKPELK